jgi:hypothetical protein
MCWRWISLAITLAISLATSLPISLVISLAIPVGKFVGQSVRSCDFEKPLVVRKKINTFLPGELFHTLLKPRTLVRSARYLTDIIGHVSSLSIMTY